ncbi:MAG: hypothetical protein QJR13_03025 [Bacillota bacterium]|nr:hypothetical protein [Bacillota bacterium]
MPDESGGQKGPVVEGLAGRPETAVLPQLALAALSRQPEHLDVNTVLGFLGLLNLWEILELLQGRRGAASSLPAPAPAESGRGGVSLDSLLSLLAAKGGGKLNLNALLPLLSALSEGSGGKGVPPDPASPSRPGMPPVQREGEGVKENGLQANGHRASGL